MRVTLGKKGDYAVRAVLWLSLFFEEGGAPVKGREIAGATGIPETYLAQVVTPLIRAGLVESTAGPGGGYRLAREPRSISLLEVVEVAEGPLEADRCVMREVPCGFRGPCAIHEDWSDAREMFRARLATVDFETLRLKESEVRRVAPAPADQVAG